MSTQTEITPGLEPGVIETSSSEIISPEMPGPAPGESMLLQLRQLAEEERDQMGEEAALRGIHELNKKRIGLKLLRSTYTRVKAAYQQEKAAKEAPIPTEEEIAAKEQADRELQGKQKQIQRIVKSLQQKHDLVPIIHRLLKRSGYICDKGTAENLSLIQSTRLLPTSTACFFTGASASGKSAGVIKSAAMLPSEMVLSLTSFSDQAIFYLGGVQHIVLMFGEMSPPIDGQDDPRQMAMRQLISENKVTRGVVEKVDGKANTLVIKETEGPCVMVATTTREPQCFHDELQNRAAWLPSNDSAETTRAVLTAIADRAASSENRNDPWLALAIEAFHEFHRTLAPLEVLIPFAHEIKPDNDHVTARRLFPMLLNYGRANALLHQYSRERQGEMVVATIEDYELAYRVIVSSAPRVLETCPATARKPFDEALRPALSDGRMMSTNQIVQLLGKPRQTVDRWLKKYVESGLLVCLDHRVGKQNIYQLAEDSPAHFTQDLGLVPPEAVKGAEFEKLYNEDRNDVVA